MELTKYTGPGGMAVEELGAGRRILFVHGGGAGGALAWKAQAALAADWLLVMPSRPGYGASAPNPSGREDFDYDAGLIAQMIQPDDHIVAHSYGAVVAMLAVAKVADRVASLTIIESGTSDIAKDDPAVTAFHYAVLGLAAHPPADEEQFLRTLFRIIEPGRPLPPVLPPPLRAFARHLPHFRFPAEAVVPEAALRGAGIPYLHVSGGHSAAYEGITDCLAARLGGRRIVIEGGCHMPQQTGAPFNAALEQFIQGQVK